jgi:methylated-DNA-[protein]-cysteine S-methyltransferase
MISACQYPTPAGPLSVLATDLDSTAVIVAAGFCPPEELWERLPPSERGELRHVPDLGPLHQPVLAYLDGDLESIEQIPVRQSGTDLQLEVWHGLRRIPAGETRSYRDLAEAIGNPNAVRAAASACGKNLIAPFVPCHRVVRTDGSLGGYRYGLEAKRWLLDHESDRHDMDLAAS